MLDLPFENLPRAVFHTVAYSDVFEYPLTAPEVWRYLAAEKASLDVVREALANDGVFAQVGEYFVLRGREQTVAIRKHRANIASRLWPKAARYGRAIAALPFVRMVAVTGSLAMSNTDEGNDVDFMIVTAPRRLWTVRALTLLLARFARLEGVRLCPNYLVTTSAMELSERSSYAAHDLAQMIPLSGMEVYGELRRQNDWVEDYLPNASGAPPLSHGVEVARNPRAFQRLVESLLPSALLDRFETWEMNRKIARLRREQSSSPESFFSADVCKGHIDQHGKRVVTAFAVRLAAADQSDEGLACDRVPPRLSQLPLPPRARSGVPAKSKRGEARGEGE